MKLILQQGRHRNEEEGSAVRDTRTKRDTPSKAPKLKFIPKELTRVLSWTLPRCPPLAIRSQ
jgi:hypothetical protein